MNSYMQKCHDAVIKNDKQVYDNCMGDEVI